ncbi:uncharacterized protein LOC116160977 [Photinus pyralis]|uniref:uncharacterized protein LOC116160977 n=1 Tax=Photinus pyralis TaxID=7054 RepID=UPI0012674F15|nr:uncharacterized protein LOC116160977 [Photinus pyralis]XP_031329994.1 uncharacterized protein LOC116160977 [Photinus pyralis]
MTLVIKFCLNSEVFTLEVPHSEESLWFNLTNDDEFTRQYIQELHAAGQFPTVPIINEMYRIYDDEKILLWTANDDNTQETLNLNKTEEATDKPSREPYNQTEDDRATWTNGEVLALIAAYETHKENFNSAKKRKHVWEVISNELISLGVEKHAKSCETKWRNLIRTYKAIKER